MEGLNVAAAGEGERGGGGVAGLWKWVVEVRSMVCLLGEGCLPRRVLSWRGVMRG